MILDRPGLVLLLRLSHSVEAVSREAEKVKETLIDPEEARTPDEGYLEDIVSGLEKVGRPLSSLVSLYPEEAVEDVKRSKEDLL